MNVPIVMTDEQAESRVTVDTPGGRDGSRPGPVGWLLPLIVMLVLGAIWSFHGDVTEEATVPPDLGAAEPVTITTMPSLGGDLSSGWVAIDLPGKGAIVEILESRFGLIAVGTYGSETSLWRSSDGIIWDLVDTEDGAFAGAEVNALVETESGLVAVGAWMDAAVQEEEADGVYGRERRRPAVWLSADGETWERIPDNLIERSAGDSSSTPEARRLGSMNDVVVWEGHLVAVGWSGAANHLGAAWVADLDGRTWKPATRGLAGSGTAFTEASSVSVVDQSLVAVGSILSRPTVWRSPDAMTWSVVDPRDALGTKRHDRPVKLAAGSAGVVAIGSHQQRLLDYVEPPARAYSVIWLSRDGEEWLRLEPEELTGVVLEDAVDAEPWLVAAGVQGAEFSNRPGIWYSSTGAEWQAVDVGLEGYEWGESTVNALARHGPGLVAGGSLQGQPEIWLWTPEGSGAIPETVWVRPDSGRWVLRSEFGSDFSGRSIGVTPGGYAVIDQTVVRTSLDGLAWDTRSRTEAGLKSGTWYSAPVTIGGTAYSVGEDGSVWSSPSGRFWTVLADGFSGWLEGPRPGRNGELLLVEHPRDHLGDEEDQFRIWKSVDGVNWSALPLPPAEYIQNVAVVGDRYVLLTWSEGGPLLWASKQDGGWEAVELGEDLEPSGNFVEINGRLLMAVSTLRGWEGREATTRILSTSDGLIWEMSETEFAGWPDQLGQAGPSMVMILATEGQGYSMPVFTTWSSVDGMEWTQLGPLPSFGDSWPRLVPDPSAIKIVIQSESYSGMWEWVPPAG